MSAITHSAPGKAVICGEYAVLRGGPAVAMALNRRAVVKIDAAKGDVCSIATPGFSEGSWSFRPGVPGVIDWLDEPSPAGLRLPEEVIDAVGASFANPVDISIDTRAFLDTSSGKKLGIGSSAAATVALVAALVEAGTDVRQIVSLARSAHRNLQGGRGSGVDVATSSYGGLIEYRQHNDRPASPLQWPAELPYRFFYSGQAVDTCVAIDQAVEDNGHQSNWSALIAAAEAAAGAFKTGGPKAVFDAVGDYARALRDFDNALELGIFGAGYDVLSRAACTGGVVFKPCGAGGGDIGIALSPEIDDLDAFGVQAETMGFVPLDIHLDNSGI
jgi:phosphomevalonate kinase